uniref:Uncharacterized protein n=1 Tax=Candidozyma auris TaxID=498019 RepID=A0A0L0P8T1_CANAR
MCSFQLLYETSIACSIFKLADYTFRDETFSRLRIQGLEVYLAEINSVFNILLKRACSIYSRIRTSFSGNNPRCIVAEGKISPFYFVIIEGPDYGYGVFVEYLNKLSDKRTFLSIAQWSLFLLFFFFFFFFSACLDQSGIILRVQFPSLKWPVEA